MKNNILLTVCLLIVPFIMHAQVRGQQPLRERVEAQRVAFLTQRMDLSPEESAAFWPLYNEYRREQEKLRKQIETNKEAVMQMTDDEVNQLLNQIIDNEYLQIDMRKKDIEKFKMAIPPRKILMIAPLEKAFNREILKKIRG